jgi:Arc/MetJ-type ribon-helix-helix transcriptional regulator
VEDQKGGHLAEIISRRWSAGCSSDPLVGVARPSLSGTMAEDIVSVPLPNTAKMIELPPDLRAFAEERVRAGKSESVDDVVRDALEQKKLAVLREALDVGIAELDAGLGVETTPDELVAEVSAELGLDES